MDWIIINIAVFLCVMALTGIIIPQILLIAFRKKLFDHPDPRKIHKTEIPRLGGIAFFPSILFSIFLLYGFGLFSGQVSFINHLLGDMQSLCFISSGAILLYLTGMADDLVGVRYKAKFVMQALSAALIIFGGLMIDNLHGFCGINSLPVAVSVVLTILLVVFIINSINLIDGIDGLASGLSAVACIFYTFVFYEAGLYMFSALSIATLGALVPFFIYNVFGNPQKHQKIFMGDTGALTIGLYLSVMSIRVCQIDSATLTYNSGVIAFAPLLIPCFDVVRVYLHRLREHKNPFMPDKSHIHHKLLALGIHQRVAMPMIVGCSALVIILNFWLSSVINITLLFGLDLLLWILINMFLSRRIRSIKRAREAAEANS